MFTNAAELMLITVVVMASLSGLGVGLGILVAKVRERRFLKAFKDES